MDFLCEICGKKWSSPNSAKKCCDTTSNKPITPINIVIGNSARSSPTDLIKRAVKHDQNKPDYTYISKELLDLVAQVREFGTKKYSKDNWKLGFKYTRSLAAAMRHIVAFKEGEDLDPESGLCHLGHAVCCLEHAIYDFIHHKQNDDRYKKS